MHVENLGQIAIAVSAIIILLGTLLTWVLYRIDNKLMAIRQEFQSDFEAVRHEIQLELRGMPQQMDAHFKILRYDLSDIRNAIKQAIESDFEVVRNEIERLSHQTEDGLKSIRQYIQVSGDDILAEMRWLESDINYVDRRVVILEASREERIGNSQPQTKIHALPMKRRGRPPKKPAESQD